MRKTLEKFKEKKFKYLEILQADNVKKTRYKNWICYWNMCNTYNQKKKDDLKEKKD